MITWSNQMYLYRQSYSLKNNYWYYQYLYLSGFNMVEIVVVPIRVSWKVFLLTYCNKLKSSVAYLKSFANTNSRKDQCILLALSNSRYYCNTLLYCHTGFCRKISLYRQYRYWGRFVVELLTQWNALRLWKMKVKYLRTYAYFSTRCIFRNARNILVVIWWR